MKKQKSNSKMSKPILTLMMNPSITVVNPKANLTFEKQKKANFVDLKVPATWPPMKYFSMQWVCAKLSQCTFCLTIFAPSYELNILKKCSLS